jgi:hypothetical protein
VSQDVEVRVFSTAPNHPVDEKKKAALRGGLFVAYGVVVAGAAGSAAGAAGSAAGAAGSAGAMVSAGAAVSAAGAAELSSGALPPQAARASAMTIATGASRVLEMGSPWVFESSGLILVFKRP